MRLESAVPDLEWARAAVAELAAAASVEAAGMDWAVAVGRSALRRSEQDTRVGGCAFTAEHRIVDLRGPQILGELGVTRTPESPSSDRAAATLL